MITLLLSKFEAEAMISTDDSTQVIQSLHILAGFWSRLLDNKCIPIFQRKLIPYVVTCIQIDTAHKGHEIKVYHHLKVTNMQVHSISYSFRYQVITFKCSLLALYTPMCKILLLTSYSSDKHCGIFELQDDYIVSMW